MENDYRNTEYCSPLPNIKEKKQEIADLIKKEHPKASNIYSLIRDNTLKYKIKFINIYNDKCAYCGISFDLISKRLFEIDHVKFKKGIDNQADANNIFNLVPACFNCNRGKHSFDITDEYIDILNPDENITDVFVRDDMYYIKISDEYKNDEIIKKFYHRLKFNSKYKRLDYLLMNMIGLSKKITGSIKQELDNTIILLLKKRNIIC